MKLSKRIAFAFAVVLALVIFLQPVAIQAKDSRAVLLPDSVTKQMKRMCSRDSPRVDGVWTPSTKLLSNMESRIGKIADLDKLGVIKDPRQAYRQYLGILIDGQRYIYINGMCRQPNKDWHKRLQDVCDGGNCYWGVLYNAQSGTFSDLQRNGGGPSPIFQ